MHYKSVVIFKVVQSICISTHRNLYLMKESLFYLQNLCMCVFLCLLCFAHFVRERAQQKSTFTCLIWCWMCSSCNEITEFCKGFRYHLSMYFIKFDIFVKFNQNDKSIYKLHTLSLTLTFTRSPAIKLVEALVSTCTFYSRTKIWNISKGHWKEFDLTRIISSKCPMHSYFDNQNQSVFAIIYSLFPPTLYSHSFRPILILFMYLLLA